MDDNEISGPEPGADTSRRFQNLIQSYYRDSRTSPLPQPSPGKGTTLENRTCGDRVTVLLAGNDRVEQVYAKVDGCSLCHAGTALAAELVQGMSIPDAQSRLSAVRCAISQGDTVAHTQFPGVSLPEHMDLNPFQFLYDYPARRRCLDLPLEAFQLALDSVDSESPIE